MRESSLTHEVGDQWFHNLVGNDQLDEPWLDEALAQYITWRYNAHRYGQGGDDSFRQSLEWRWHNADKPNMPIGLPVSAYNSAEYGAVVHGRGPLFSEGLDQKLGQSNMEAFLADYARTYQWKIATTAGQIRWPGSTEAAT
jgi:aminopeptidase N